MKKKVYGYWDEDWPVDQLYGFFDYPFSKAVDWYNRARVKDNRIIDIRRKAGTRSYIFKTSRS